MGMARCCSIVTSLLVIFTLAEIVYFSTLSNRILEHRFTSVADRLNRVDFDHLDLYSGDSRQLQLRLWNDSCDITLDCLRVLKNHIYSGRQTLLDRGDHGYTLCNSSGKSKHPAAGVERKTAERHPHPVVPNIAHYVWFGSAHFHFDHLISLLSAHRIMKAERIMFHTDSEPTGKYWKEAKSSIPTLEVVHREMPMTVYNRSLKKADIRHRSDIGRLEILFQHGGVYMDNDVIVVRPLDELRHYDCVIGRESSTRLNNGIILAKRRSLFIKLFLDSYRIYNRFCWNCDSIQFPNTLAVQCPHTVHVDKRHLAVGGSFAEIFSGNFNWTGGDFFAVHTFVRWFFGLPENEGKVIHFNARDIKTLDTPFGEMCRFIYYGEADLIET